MIISPPLLPVEGLITPIEKWKTDPMMDKVDDFELSHSGVFPIAFDRRWHCGMHLVPFAGDGQLEPVRAIADGEVVAYRVALKAVSDGQTNSDGSLALNSNIGFVLLKHVTETGEGRTITFYSLYMHLLDVISTNALASQPNNPMPESSPGALAAWLLRETEGVQAGGGKKVYRKDRLGFVGQSQGEKHLHFEIFMTEADFTAWFDQVGHKVALGDAQPNTPASKDYWGHTYFVIPKGSTFMSTPPGQGNLKTKGRTPKLLFPALNAGALDANSTLYVETYFSRGERFMRAWIDKGDRKLVSLTPEPVQDEFAEYEYDLYERATTLYEACPSEGYELLRFGRILSTDTPTLPAGNRATWVEVPFAQGTTGYIDVNLASIQKLSDADFPFFMGWQKIEEGNTPFNQEGFCGYDELCTIAGVTDTRLALHAQTPTEFDHDQRLAAYVRGEAEVRVKLKGFICHAKSEWDTSNNEERFRALNEPNGFFGKRKETDPRGYENFLSFVKQFQFIKQTPLGEANKLWFFHPTAFIRHFRKCAWLSEKEFKQLVPSFTVRKHGGQTLWELVPGTFTSGNIFKNQRVVLNRMMCTYGINTPLRMASFFGNAIQESQWLQLLEEGSPTTQRYYPWFGRGFLQLTWASNYLDYWDFHGRASQIPSAVRVQLLTAQQAADRPRSNDVWQATETALTPDMHKWRANVSLPDQSDAALSAGFYWVKLRMARYADEPHVLERVGLTANRRAHSYYRSASFWKASASVNLPGAIDSLYSIRLNGFEARCMAYNVALAVLSEVKFPIAPGQAADAPDYDILRRGQR
ncbi:hypothetical protein [Caballeronia sp. GACF4]|uniref:hypothetical protein n=1 Tax=Caballeronia sp. GACF4 TaxID=2921763 RepID=UPI002027E6B9|nr:hypothetical protein [Caballeronia sp. GACF4]